MTSETPSAAAPSFSELGLGEPLLRALSDVGYETPSPIQAATIPPLLEGRDVLGQAQTGTGKTAAFALPILNRLDMAQTKPQALVLAPTRELAIQVAEAFHRYATHLRGFHVLPIYGGQSYGPQLNGLRRGAHVVVGTPGRVIDHLERGSLDLSGLTNLVLDEADEMLRMGFIDDVEKILQKTPPTRQVALFSATMPPRIKKIAQTHLKSPVEILIKSSTTTTKLTRQRFWLVSGLHKLDALTRILEAEPFEAMIVFTRTKQATEELAEKLEARGFSAAAINGDIVQAQRERTIQRLRDGQLDILVATDVAARGLDVERISHVLNYDIPHDTEAYVHRIGRTGRAGRSGEAILFVTPRERHLLRSIERATRQPIEPMSLPSVDAVNDQRIARFKQRITDTLGAGELEQFRTLIEQYENDHDIPAIEIAAALAKLVQGDAPLLLSKEARAERDRETASWNDGASSTRERGARRGDEPRARDRSASRSDFLPDRSTGPSRPSEDRLARFRADDAAPPERSRNERPTREVPTRETFERPPRATERAPRDEGSAERRPRDARFRDAKPRTPEPGMETYRIEVGNDHGVKPANIVGAVANEAGLDSKNIGRIDIHEDYSLIDLPDGMPQEIFKHLKKVWVSGQQLRITRLSEGAGAPRRPFTGKPNAGFGAPSDKPKRFGDRDKPQRFGDAGGQDKPKRRPKF